MNLTPDRQGHLSDLSQKPLSELQELLERQKKILARSAFIQTLPDKGEKCAKFAELLKSLITKKLSSCPVSVISNTVDAHKTSSFQGEETKFEYKYDPPSKIFGSKTNSQSEIKGNGSIDSLVGDVKERRDNVNVPDNATKLEDQDDLLTKSLQQLKIGASFPSGNEPVHNAYERVVKKAESHPGKERFIPSRTLKLDTGVNLPSKSESLLNLEASIKKHREIKPQLVPASEESNVRPPVYKFNKAKMISIGESIQLIEGQRSQNERILAENAAERLASRLVPKMFAYRRERDMQYREPEAGDSDDEDDDEEGQEVDYGDEDD